MRVEPVVPHTRVMGFFSQRVQLTDEPQQLTHPDKDLQPGWTAVAKCPTANFVVGGEDLTPEDGFVITVTDKLTWTAQDGAPFVMLEAGAGPEEMQVMWGGV